MVFQPFVVHDKSGQDILVYVDISFSSDSESDPCILCIVATDVHNFAKEFRVSSIEQLMESTFAMNMLSMDNRHTTAVIIDKMKHIKETFRPVLLSPTQESEEQSVHFEMHTNIITFLYGDFKYKFPLSDMSVGDQLNLTRRIYSNLEAYTTLQTGALNSLSNQITNKNQIIKKLAYSYYEKMDPFGKRPDSVHDLFKKKSISQVFVSKRIIGFSETTATDAIEQFLRHSEFDKGSSIGIVDSKLENLWDKIYCGIEKVPDQELGEKENDTKIHIEDFGLESSGKESEEKELLSSGSTTQKKTKRKLQGLLRREQKKMKISSAEP